MGKNALTEQQKFNYGKHREKYQKEIFQLIEDIKNIPADKMPENINNYFVLKLYTLLKNFGIYTDYDIDNTIKYFEEEEAIFYQKLEEYLSDVNNKRKIYKSLFIIKNQILNIRDFSSNGFYRDFLDDLKSEIGLMIKTKYNNFIEPAVYDSFTQKQAFIDFLEDINVIRERKGKTPYTEESFGREAVNG